MTFVYSLFSVRSVMHRYLEKKNEVNFDKIFNQMLGEYTNNLSIDNQDGWQWAKRIWGVPSYLALSSHVLGRFGSCVLYVGETNNAAVAKHWRSCTSDGQKREWKSADVSRGCEGHERFRGVFFYHKSILSLSLSLSLSLFSNIELCFMDVRTGEAVRSGNDALTVLEFLATETGPSITFARLHVIPRTWDRLDGTRGDLPEEELVRENVASKATATISV